jgi:hypothetical protein
MKPRLILLFLGLIAASDRGFGQVLVYNFGPSATPTTNATTTALNTTDSVFSSLAGSGTTSTTSPGSTTAGGSGGAYFSANTFRTSDNNYFYFTITPSSGYQVSLTNVSFYYLSTSTGPSNSTLQSSSDSYGSDLATFTLTRAAASPVAADWHQTSTSITLTFTSPTTFRITGTGASSSAGGFRIDDVTFSGAVSAIPEPSAYAAIAGAIMLAGATWKRLRPRPAL